MSGYVDAGEGMAVEESAHLKFLFQLYDEVCVCGVAEGSKLEC